MFRRYWLHQVLNSLQASSRRARRSGGVRPNVEVFEERKLLSATMSVVDHGATLKITGDRGDNHIAITQDARGVHVVADDVAQTFTGIRNIEINAGAGNDTITADVAFPPDPCRIAVNAGAGDDVVNVVLGGATQTTVPGDIDVMLDGGQGNDDLSLIARSQPRTVGIGSEETPLSPPVNPALITTGQIHIRLEGGGGTDQFHGDITPCVLPQTTAGLPQGLIDMVFVGGSGNEIGRASCRERV